MKSFTDIFIKRPVLAVVVNLIILAVGWSSIKSLPVRQYPRVESTSVIITTPYIGASADTVRGFITTPIERAVSAIDGVDYIESVSTAGISSITVRLRLNHDSTAALAEISARLNQVRSELPQEAESPVVDIQRADKPYATFYISFISDSMSLTQLTDYLDRQVRPELNTIEGVQRVGVEGARNIAMRIWLDPDRMTNLNITSDQVDAALRRNNFLATVGRTKSAEVQIDLLTDTDLRTPQEFEQMIVREIDGSVVRLRDVAKVELGSEEPTAEAGLDGKPAIYLSVWPLPKANELEVATLLKAEMRKLESTLPPGVDMAMAFDGTYYMENALREIAKTLLETVAIVGLVVFLFMGSLRTVLVPLLAMPVSLVGAALFMLIMGFSLNLLTILAIVLAVGLVVDDAIVMVENVERHIRAGRTKLQAAIIGARELVAPIISMTITLAAVYAPIGFQGGLTGVLFREFAFTLAAAVVVSGVVALTLSPIMSARMIPANGKEGWFTRFVNRRFERVRNLYSRLLDTTLQLRWTMALAAVLITIGAVPLYTMSSKELAPTEDEGMIFLILQGPPEATLDYTRERAQQVSSVLLAVPETKAAWQLLQMSSGFGGLNTVPWNERKRSTHEILPGVYGAMSQITGLSAFASLPQPLPGAGQFDVELVLTSNDPPQEMAKYADRLVQAAFQSGKFMFADTDLKIDLPQARLVIDKEKVADMGLDLTSVGRELGVLLGGNYVNRFNLDGRSYKVIPQVADADRLSPQALTGLKVQTRDGGLVSVASFVTIVNEVAPRTLNRFQQRNSVKVFGGVAPGVAKEDALSALEDAARAILPAGYGLDYAGESRQLRTEGSSLAVTLGFALGLIYLVLAAQFSSFRDPLIVLLGSVPLAISGALIFTFVGWTTINIYSQVGLITLIGLVAKNGILIVEFANHLQEKGRTKLTAVKEAALTRLRPILMTSAATVFGHIPLVLVTGAGAEARNSIGIVLVSGMVISTLFTLLFVPSVYMLIAATHRKDVNEELDESLLASFADLPAQFPHGHASQTPSSRYPVPQSGAGVPAAAAIP